MSASIKFAYIRFRQRKQANANNILEYFIVKNWLLTNLSNELDKKKARKEGKQKWNMHAYYRWNKKRQFQNLYKRIKLNLMPSPLDFIIWSKCACGFLEMILISFWLALCACVAMDKSIQYVPYFFICWDFRFLPRLHSRPF